MCNKKNNDNLDASEQCPYDGEKCNEFGTTFCELECVRNPNSEKNEN